VDAALVAAEPEAAEELPVEVTVEALSLAAAASGWQRRRAELEGASPTEEAQWELGPEPPVW